MARRSDRTTPFRSTCPIACALDLVGDRWTLLVLRDLLRARSRFGELLDSPEGIPTNILADRLKRLEVAGIIESTPYQNNPPRKAYALTEKGLGLKSVMGALANWGAQHIPGTQADEAVARALRGS